ncbi:unnamed protein product, partial [marine sediment metagenome]
MFNNRKKEKYKSRRNKIIEIYVIIVKENRQTIEHFIQASRRFVFEDGTYIIKRDCIFLKNINGMLRQCLLYSEGNPNPYNFKYAKEDITIDDYIPEYNDEDDDETTAIDNLRTKLEGIFGDYICKKGSLMLNIGLKPSELDRIYGSVLYEILVRIQSENKMFFLFLFTFISMFLSVLMLLVVIFGVVL